MPSSRGSSPPRDQTHVSYISCIGRQVLYPWCHLGSPNEIVLKKRRIIQSLVLKQVDTFWKKICSFTSPTYTKTNSKWFKELHFKNDTVKSYKNNTYKVLD